MKRLILIALLLVAAGLVGGAALGGCATTTTKEGPASLSAMAEKVRKGEIDVGKAYGMAPDRRFHKIHSEVVALECATCHADKVPASAEAFMVRPAVDVSAESPAPVDRRACLGCHLSGPGRNVYGSRAP